MPHRQKQKSNNKAKKPGPALPIDASAGVQRLIRISQTLLSIAEKETQALLLGDMLAFSILQYEKEKLAGDYTKASEDFRSRLEDFRKAERGLLNRLEKLQKDLAEKANANNALVEQAYQRAQFNARKGVRSINDLGGKKRVRFDKIEPVSTEGAQS